MGTVHSLKDRELWAKDWSKALKLYPSERALLLYLAYKAGKKGKVYGRSLDRLAEELSQSRRTLISPNPPKDTDGRREGSGRGWVRELQGRWPGLLG